MFHTMVFFIRRFEISPYGDHSLYHRLNTLSQQKKRDDPIRICAHPWKDKYKRTLVVDFYLHVDALLLLQKTSVEPQDIHKVKDAIEDFLSDFGLTDHQIILADLVLWRIDYCRNIMVSPTDRICIFNLLKQSAMRCNYMTANKNYESSVMWYNGSREFIIYDKSQERRDKKETIMPYEKDVIRTEMQLKHGHTQNVKPLPRVPFDYWATPMRSKKYLSQIEKYIPHGDFYTLEKAIEIVEQSGLKQHYKKNLKEFLNVTAQKNLSAAKKLWKAENTAKKYLNALENLGVNPMTITSDDSRKYHITHICNPFYD